MSQKLYFNHASCSPLTPASLEKAVEMATLFSQQGAGAFATSSQYKPLLKEQLRQITGAHSADEIALVPNVSYGLNTVAHHFPWKKGDKILLFEGEFPANIIPWMTASKAYDLEIVWCPLTPFLQDPQKGLAQLETLLSQQKIALLSVSAVQFLSGLAMPLESIGKLCQRYGCTFCVDAIQALGVLPIEVQRCQIDFLAGGSHKWLKALPQAGFLYASPEQIEKSEPKLGSWLGKKDPIDFLFQKVDQLDYDRPWSSTADRFECASMNDIGYASLYQSLLSLNQKNLASELQAIKERAEPLVALMKEKGFEPLLGPRVLEQSTIFSFRPPDSLCAQELSQKLAEQGVACSAPTGILRISAHHENDRQSFSQFLSILATTT